jgi:hypothetical protein
VWARDSSAGSGRDLVSLAIWPVVSALERLDVTAELAGSFANPRLSIRSNVDDAIALRLKSLAGDALARAEARVRAEVDRHVAEPARAARAGVESIRGEVEIRLDELDGALARVRAELERRLGVIGALVRD